MYCYSWQRNSFLILNDGAWIGLMEPVAVLIWIGDELVLIVQNIMVAYLPQVRHSHGWNHIYRYLGIAFGKNIWTEEEQKQEFDKCRWGQARWLV